MIKIYFTKFSENHNPFCKIFEIIFTNLIFQSILNKNKKIHYVKARLMWFEEIFEERE
ncbi:hypothetical protein SPAR76_1184 [Streptococcus pneumoniae GA43264]|nr:hypothetical protein SPAR5_1009 [Streptococcus pneumoniae GA04375]EHD30959.1 hypothetical protein SPAR19_1054 [Streptococcus pneumoniae GA11184]EHD33743.1 hypothetical protein SPAR121_0874 [Streptococcus pneumoniae 6735-05]EHD60204.1 hypothetical protein SPAR70_1101 [Streptococcus pneumoniae GA41410]EHD66613.1 hypothetical protein SPAR125_1086 [Streptococcus pneumoniae 5787-06]EHE04101.1 hypothetical protein SPAR41_1257 [Streptococcus pneumoniae GA16833]EHE30910.1 hypothetical protein SPAR